MSNENLNRDVPPGALGPALGSDGSPAPAGAPAAVRAETVTITASEYSRYLAHETVVAKVRMHQGSLRDASLYLSAMGQSRYSFAVRAICDAASRGEV